MGFFEKIKSGLARTKQSMTVSMNNLFSSFTGENEEFFDDLEETLILADAGVETAEKAVERLRACGFDHVNELYHDGRGHVAWRQRGL